MKNLWLVMMVLWGAGCAAVPNSIAPAAGPQAPSDRVTPGMTYTMVAAVMDARVTVGYDIDPVTGAAKPVQVQNLFSSEIVKINGVDLRIDRYIVRAPATGGKISEADLFPVAYRDGLVVARGRAGVNALQETETVAAEP